MINVLMCGSVLSVNGGMVSELNLLSCVGVKARVCEARFKKSRSSEAR